MKTETIDGIIHVDFSKVTLNDISNIIAQISVDAGVSNTAPTEWYGKYRGCGDEEKGG